MRRRARAALLAALLLAAGGVAVDRWIAATELPDLAPAVSVTMLDREGRLLRAWTTEGRWRLAVAVE